MESKTKIETTTQKTNVLTIVSLVTGIVGFLSICFSFIPGISYICMGVMGLCGVAGIVTGFLGMNQIKNTLEKGKGMAIAGIILGILTLLSLCVVGILAIFVGPITDLINQTFNDIFQQLNTY